MWKFAFRLFLLTLILGLLPLASFSSRAGEIDNFRPGRCQDSGGSGDGELSKGTADICPPVGGGCFNLEQQH